MYTRFGIIQRSIALLMLAGNLVASSPSGEIVFPDSAEKKHLTLDTYNQYFGKKKLKGRSLQVSAVKRRAKVFGYVLMLQNKEEETEFE